jgi:hypothetical protein
MRKPSLFAEGLSPTDHRVVRKFLILFLTATALCIWFVTPAAAQKDPFAPLVTDESTSTSGTTTTTNTTTGTSSVPASSSRPAVLSPTGISADVWSAIAMLLVLTGSAVLVFDRYRALA